MRALQQGPGPLGHGPAAGLHALAGECRRQPGVGCPIPALTDHRQVGPSFPQLELRRAGAPSQGGRGAPPRPLRKDAARRGIADGEVVRVHNDRGSLTVRARVGDRVRTGVCALPFGW
ncbi:MAG TPA: molybdopterin dinucleotide binding domain-containing protein [Candidatus Dormibacteraeota bacterium]|nr:molybdopterin dinucleotide binding domain-containing protein [Candidatus Dormibacteraeota bacterium]